MTKTRPPKNARSLDTSRPPGEDGSMNFSALVAAIRATHAQCAVQANRAVNVSLTLRNWVIGCYIFEYEQGGEDRAKYGDGMMDRLAEELGRHGIPTCERPRLYAYVAFYRTYPQVRDAIPAGWAPRLPPAGDAIVRSLTGKSEGPEEGQIVRSLTGQSAIPGKMLIERLSYTHLELLVGLDSPLKRAFYEVETIRGNWAVRALKRQIGSLYFERSGLSIDKEKLAAITQAGAEQASPALAIRDPYVFEFLGLKAREAVSESDLENALLDNLQDFLLELGNGFCFEARQKGILIGQTRGFVDLVFYHRILKCHILIELKVAEFTHEHIGQLNTYVTWFRRHMMAEGDNPPVGLLLCTGKDHAFVEYALAGMDNRLFVSKYLLELPEKDALQRFLDEKRREIAGVDDLALTPEEE